MRKLLVIVLIVLAIFIGYLITQILDFIKPKIRFGAMGFTEYSPGKPGKVFVQVLDSYNKPIDNAICNITIYYPNLSYFVKDYYMKSFERGFYYFDFVAPDVEGVYMVDISCLYPSQKNVYYPGDSLLWYIDGNTKATELTATFQSLNATNTYVEIYFTNIGKNGHSIYINNTCSNSWDYLGSVNIYTPYFSKNFDLYCHNPPTIYITNKGGAVDMVNIVGWENATSTIANLRGGGEIHVEAKVYVPYEGTPYVKPIS